MRCRKQQRRLPHPDAAIEAELRRILSMRLAIERKEQELEDLGEEIGELRADIRVNMGSGLNSARLDLITRWEDRIRELEADVTGLHDAIDVQTGTVAIGDRVYLDGVKTR